MHLVNPVLYEDNHDNGQVKSIYDKCGEGKHDYILMEQSTKQICHGGAHGEHSVCDEMSSDYWLWRRCFGYE